jgi:hypothetical protein
MFKYFTIAAQLLTLFSLVFASPLSLQTRDNLSGFGICMNNSPMKVHTLTHTPAYPGNFNFPSNDLESAIEYSHLFIKGERISISVAADLSQPILPGTRMHISAHWGLIKVMDETYDFCKDATSACPIDVSTKSITFGFPIPNIKVHAKVKVRATLTDAKGKQVLCLENSKFTING